MRIIAGLYKGKKLFEFEGEKIRPTSDRAREALFNILQNEIVGSNFYDGFSGTGAVGLEALSRGANNVVMTDNSKESYNLIEKNLKHIGANAKIFLSDALSFLQRTSLKFDFMFFDPPYSLNVMNEIMKVILEKNILNKNGTIIYEHNKNKNYNFEGYSLIQKRIYGIAEFDWFKLEK